MLVQILCTFLISLIIFKFVKSHSQWKRRGIKQPKIWEIIGDTLKSTIGLETFAQSMKKVYNRFPNDRIYGIYQFGSPLLLVKDPDVIKEITVKSFEHFIDRRSMAGSEDDIFWMKNLSTLAGEKWRRMRITLSPTFTGSKMRTMFVLMHQVTKRYVDYYLRKPEEVIEVNIKDSLSRLSNDIMASCAFGIEINSLDEPKNTFFLNAKRASNLSSFINNIKFIMTINFPKIAQFLNIKLMPVEVTNFFKDIILKNMKTREELNIRRPDVINLLMETKKGILERDEVKEENDENFAATKEWLQKAPNEKVLELTDDDIVSQVLVFILGGFETVSNAIAFALYEVAVNVDVQEKLQSEIDDVTSKNSDFTYEILMKMKYLDMVTSESLRKWPPGIQLDRVCTKPYTIKAKNTNESDIKVEEGDVISINMYSLHHDPDYFPDPERFDPERFSDENKHKINLYMYLPFGQGPRTCIASRLALMEMKMSLVQILQKFQVVVLQKTDVPVKLANTHLNLVPSRDIWLGFKKRK